MLENAYNDYTQAYKLSLRTQNFINNITLLLETISYHNSVTDIMSLKNFISDTANICMTRLNKTKKWKHNLISDWNTTHDIYINAVSIYLEEYLKKLSVNDKEASKKLNDKIVNIISRNNKTLTNDLFSKYTDEVQSCKNFETFVLQGNIILKRRQS